ncbi:alpha-mannosidase [Schaalia sp. 19OD2882]|uniref:alpha-mannosidase n=1 Tax=Schaalia sp. 19OD2882 TaxID=2794089 RepID=UPI001C1E96B4|nr:glycoside hydrolase family 38 C-terminal domain-containing protein [Schaalia sp. 19OD2882]QWW19991.1 alpha-mannosidase [Schaalia sp. 19OD2882]
MHHNRSILHKRVERTLREKLAPATVSVIGALDVSAWRVPLEAGVIGEPIPYALVPLDEFTPIAVGDTWGAPWQTTWMLFTAQIPSSEQVALAPGDTLEARIDLGWQDHSPGFQCEGLVRDEDGRTVKALNPRNTWVPLPAPAEDETPFRFTVEAAANPLLLDVPPFQVTYQGHKTTATSKEAYALTRADLVVRHAEVDALFWDMTVLSELIAVQEDLDARGWQILLALSHAIDVLDLQDIPNTAAAARAVLAPLLAEPASPSAHHLSAVGHAHIDSGWLWPLRETRRKVNRTLANVVRLLDDGADMIFALPAAQHVAWLEEEDPELFERVKRHVARGRIVPVGSMWVEADGQLPGGEALARQFVEGERWFREKLDFTCKEMWLPDSFGYSAALPQIAREAGICRFLTQKISWNQVDKFPHHTFLWEGIDGTRIFTHFPPVDTYGSEITAEQLHHAQTNFQDKGCASASLLPYGYGDGGGGPTRDMGERITRFANLAGAPRIEHETPQQFFDRAIAEYPDPPVWVGELYLELHRGTLTSQIAIKQGNRRCESVIREAEHWAALAAHAGLVDYPHEELRKAWQDLLLTQFHDILPGTSIAWVNEEAAGLHRRVLGTCEEVITRSLRALTGADAVHVNPPDAPRPHEAHLANASAFPERGVAPFAADAQRTGTASAALTFDPETRTASNGRVTARFDESGALVSLRGKDGAELVPPGGRAGVFEVFQDFPNMWDAWDIDPFYKGTRQVLDLEPCGIEQGPDRIVVRAASHFRNSELRLAWILDSDAESIDLHVHADWHEHEHLCKLAFPVDIHTDHAQFETQFGHLRRPIHENTSWDACRFEVSAHRWLRLAHATAALSIANDATYGWDLTRHLHQDGTSGRRRGTWTLVRATLVKSARFPDPEQDQGSFEWNFRLHPGATTLDAVADGQHLNLRQRFLDGAQRSVAAPFTVDGAVVESVCVIPHTDNSLALRLYEARGGSSTVHLHTEADARVRLVDLLYRESEAEPELTDLGGGHHCVELSPFQIITIRIDRGDRE